LILFIEWSNKELFGSTEMECVAQLILCPELTVTSIRVDILVDPPPFLHDVKIKTTPGLAKECHGIGFLSPSGAKTSGRS
jgi:hypothetical protein